jgi:hypothetical protein
MSSKSNANSKQKTRKETLELWQHHHRQWSASQLNRKAYCREHQLNYDCFQYWYHKINKVDQIKSSLKQDANAALIPIKLANVAPPPLAQALCQLNAAQGCQLLIFDSKLANDLFERLI